MSYEDTNCDSMTNLALLDPSKWGWSAAGNIVDLCPPHEKARRSQGIRDFMARQRREQTEEKRRRTRAINKLKEKNKSDAVAIGPSLGPEEEKNVKTKTTVGKADGQADGYNDNQEALSSNSVIETKDGEIKTKCVPLPSPSAQYSAKTMDGIGNGKLEMSTDVASKPISLDLPMTLTSAPNKDTTANAPMKIDCNPESGLYSSPSTTIETVASIQGQVASKVDAARNFKEKIDGDGKEMDMDISPISEGTITNTGQTVIEADTNKDGIDIMDQDHHRPINRANSILSKVNDSKKFDGLKKNDGGGNKDVKVTDENDLSSNPALKGPPDTKGTMTAMMIGAPEIEGAGVSANVRTTAPEFISSAMDVETVKNIEQKVGSTILPVKTEVEHITYQASVQGKKEVELASKTIEETQQEPLKPIPSNKKNMQTVYVTTAQEEKTASEGVNELTKVGEAQSTVQQQRKLKSESDEKLPEMKRGAQGSSEATKPNINTPMEQFHEKQLHLIEAPTTATKSHDGKNISSEKNAKSATKPLTSQTQPKQKYDFGQHYNIVVQPKEGKAKRERISLEVKTVNDDGTLNIDAYHRGAAGDEPRNKSRGHLICEPFQLTDTNYDWDEPDLKFTVKVEFPLVDPDEYEEDEDENKGDGEADLMALAAAVGGLRRNARRGEEKKFVSETERAMKRHAKLASLPHYREFVEWNLSQKSPTPMVYAADIAAEFDLSFCVTLDLARSIQSQIDEYVRENLDYHVPLSAEDPLGIPRSKETVQPPKYPAPKLLHGGHCATNITTTSKPFESREMKRAMKKEMTAKKYVQNKTKGVNPKVPADVKPVPPGLEVCPANKLPKHDFTNLGIDPIYGIEFLRRAKVENQEILKKIADGNIGVPRFLSNHSCHFCRQKRPQCIQFPCGNESHCYCDLHTSKLLGFRVSDSLYHNLDYCPICCLQCICYRCNGRVNDLVPAFAKECKDQGLGPKEAKFDFIWYCNRTLARSVKRFGASSTCTGVAKSTRRKNQSENASPSKGNVIEAPKVPKIDFPSELSAGINRDPSLKNDYYTIFTPKGSRICDKALAKAPKQETKPKETLLVEDGNVDHCDICKKAGDLVCCDRCPRGFHSGCIGNITKEVPDHWECPRCVEDSSAQEGDAMDGSFALNKLSSVYKVYAETPNFEKKLRVIGQIYDMCQFLMKYDFGAIFSEPVDCKIVRDYKSYVKKPMDLGTLCGYLLKGHYLKTLYRNVKDLPGAENATEMDILTLKVLRDVEQIWHNCFLYNREGSSFYRMGQVLKRKSQVIRYVNFENDLDPFVSNNLEAFVDECKTKREELSHSLKPWIPTSKYSINIPTRGSTRRAVAIFDKDSNMVIKQYSGMAAACSVAEFLSKLNYKSEIKVSAATRPHLKAYICQMPEDPSLLLFGYRWLYMDLVRSGMFKTQKQSTSVVVKRVCQISQTVLAGFETIEDSYKDWLAAVNNCTGMTQISEVNRTIHYFQEIYLDGGASVENAEWVRVNSDKKDSATANSSREMDTFEDTPPSTIQTTIANIPTSDVASNVGEAASTCQINTTTAILSESSSPVEPTNKEMEGTDTVPKEKKPSPIEDVLTTSVGKDTIQVKATKPPPGGNFAKNADKIMSMPTRPVSEYNPAMSNVIDEPIQHIEELKVKSGELQTQVIDAIISVDRDQTISNQKSIAASSLLEFATSVTAREETGNINTDDTTDAVNSLLEFANSPGKIGKQEQPLTHENEVDTAASKGVPVDAASSLLQFAIGAVAASSNETSRPSNKRSRSEVTKEDHFVENKRIAR